jgi:purine-binding chemotaxis protein CheW
VRTDGAASPARSEDGGIAAEALDALVLPVGADLYAIAIDWVREVVGKPRLTRLPGTPPSVLGVFNLRGEIVPLFDTAALLGVGTTTSGPFAAVVESRLGLAGLATTGTPEAAALGDPMGPSDLAGATASYALGRRVVTLIDLEVLLEAVPTPGMAP